MRQIPIDRYDRSDKLPVGAVLTTITDLESRTEIQFKEDRDELDTFCYAAIETASGKQYFLQWYADNPPVGILILGNLELFDPTELALELQLAPDRINPAHPRRED